MFNKFYPNIFVGCNNYALPIMVLCNHSTTLRASFTFGVRSVVVLLYQISAYFSSNLSQFLETILVLVPQRGRV